MNVRYILPVGIFCVIALISGVAMISILNGDQSRTQLPSPLIGKKAPELVLTSYGRSQASSDAALDFKQMIGDKPFIVNYFASWCAPCQKEIPFLEKLSQKVPVIGVAYKDKPDALAIFLERFGNPFLHIGLDNDGKTAIDWGVYGIPETFLISDEGIIIIRHAGEITHDVYRSVFLPKIKEMMQ